VEPRSTLGTLVRWLIILALGLALAAVIFTAGFKLWVDSQTGSLIYDYDDPALPGEMGALMGRMHRLARGYHPATGTPALGHWYEADWLQDPHRALHPSQAAAAEAIVRLRDTIAGFPRDQAHYGIIHDDFHGGNVFRLPAGLAVIDFDNCHQSRFAADIASAVLFPLVYLFPFVLFDAISSEGPPRHQHPWASALVFALAGAILIAAGQLVARRGREAAL
jgi:hypothetical protein